MLIIFTHVRSLARTLAHTHTRTLAHALTQPDEVLAAVSVKASSAHVQVQQLLSSGGSDDSKLLELHERLTSSLVTYASLGRSTAAIEPWVGEPLSRACSSMPTDELVVLLEAESVTEPTAPSVTPSVFAAVRSAETWHRPPSRDTPADQPQPRTASRQLKEHMQRFGLDYTVQTVLEDNGVKALDDVLEIEDADAQSLGLNLVDRKKLAKLRAHVQQLSDSGVLGQRDFL